MPSRKNFPSHVKARRVQALEQVKARVKANGRASETAPKEKQDITGDRERQRREQAKHEQALLEKRV